MSWRNESERHALASKGVRTSLVQQFHGLQEFPIEDEIELLLSSSADIMDVEVHEIVGVSGYAEGSFVIHFKVKGSGKYGSPYSSALYYNSRDRTLHGEIRLEGLDNEDDMEDFKRHWNLIERDRLKSFYVLDDNYGIRFGVYEDEQFPHLIVKHESVYPSNIIQKIENVLDKIYLIKGDEK